MEKELVKELKKRLDLLLSRFDEHMKLGELAEAMHISICIRNITEAVLSARHLEAHLEDEDIGGESWKD